MSFYGASDLDTMLAEFGVPVEFTRNGFITTGRGIIDVIGVEAIDTGIGNFTATVTTVIVKTGAFPNMHTGMSLKVNGVSYVIVTIRQEADGAITRVYVRT